MDLGVLSVAVRGGGHTGPTHRLRLDERALTRPWEETGVDFEARLKY